MNLDWSGFCHRCLTKVSSYSMSWFNEQLICTDCSVKEAKSPSYNSARKAELEAVRDGNYNFKGIGIDNE